MTGGAQRRQVVGGRLVRRRVVDGPVVRLGGGLLAAQLAVVVRAGEGLVAGAQVDRVLVVELRALRRHGLLLLCCQWRTSRKAASSRSSHTIARYVPGSSPGSTTRIGSRTPRHSPVKGRRESATMVSLSVWVVLVSSHTFSPVVVLRCVVGTGFRLKPVVVQARGAVAAGPA